MFGINVTHARAVNDRWAYKISAGDYTSDAFSRPTGPIPNGTGTQYPAFAEPGHDAAEVHPPRRLRRARRQVQAGDRRRLLGHRRHHPHRHRAVRHAPAWASATARCATRAGRSSSTSSPTSWTATPTACWRSAPTASRSRSSSTPRPTTSSWATSRPSARRNVLTYGGNLRCNNFDLSIAPLGNSRTEVGGYVQDEIFLNDQFRLNLGARVDKFANIDDAGVLAAHRADRQAGGRSRHPRSPTTRRSARRR